MSDSSQSLSQDEGTVKGIAEPVVAHRAERSLMDYKSETAAELFRIKGRAQLADRLGISLRGEARAAKVFRLKRRNRAGNLSLSDRGSRSESSGRSKGILSSSLEDEPSRSSKRV